MVFCCLIFDVFSIKINLLKEKGYLVSGDVVLLTQGDESEGTTNVCRTLTVE